MGDNNRMSVFVVIEDLRYDGLLVRGAFRSKRSAMKAAIILAAQLTADDVEDMSGYPEFWGDWDVILEQWRGCTRVARETITHPVLPLPDRSTQQ